MTKTYDAVRADFRGYKRGTVFARRVDSGKWEKIGTSADAKWLAMEIADANGVDRILYRQMLTRVQWYSMGWKCGETFSTIQLGAF